MNIFFLGYSLEQGSGGIENYTFTVLSYLQKNGHDVYVCTVKNNNKKFNNLPFKKNKYIDKLFLGRRISHSLESNNIKIDIFLCGHLFLAKHLEYISRKRNNTYDLFVYGIECWAGKFKKRKKTLKHLNKIISISSFTTNQIIDQGFNGEIVYAPPVIDTGKFLKLNLKKEEGVIRFITVGRLSSNEQYKGHDKVIDAVDLLINKFNIKNIEYCIVGKGNDKKRLEEKVKNLELDKLIKFYGFVSNDDLASVYAQSDVFIMPSNVSLNQRKPEGEGFGIAFIEAAMYELPLIGPKDGGSTDIIEHGINGLECDPLDVNNIAETMLALIKSKEKRLLFGKNAKQKVTENFTLKRLDKDLEGIIQSSNNSSNKKWWDNNPMTYVEEDIDNWGNSIRFVSEKPQFEKLNRDYLETNPYLKTFFNDESVQESLKGKSILDLGTGWGSSALLLDLIGGNVTAIDISDTSIKGAKTNNKLFGKGNIDIFQMDAENLDFPDNNFDFIYSWGVIHHSNVTENILDETSRVLKPGGRGLLMVYNRFSTRYYFIGLWYLLIKGKIFQGENLQSVQKYFTDGYWHRHFSPREFSLILKKSGLITEKIELTYMARRILPGIKEGSKFDKWLKRNFGWLLVATISKE